MQFNRAWEIYRWGQNSMKNNTKDANFNIIRHTHTPRKDLNVKFYVSISVDVEPSIPARIGRIKTLNELCTTLKLTSWIMISVKWSRKWNLSGFIVIMFTIHMQSNIWLNNDLVNHCQSKVAGLITDFQKWNDWIRFDEFIQWHIETIGDWLSHSLFRNY